MDNTQFDITGLCSEEIEKFHYSYKALKETYDIELTGNIDFHLEQFEVFRNYLNIKVRNSFVIKQDHNNDCYILFVESTLRPHTKGKHAGECDYQIWVLAYLKDDFGRVLIRRETLADKIIELVHPVELDFEEDKAFSDTFYVLVNDRDKAARAMARSFRNAVMDIREDNVVVEMVEHTLIAGNHHPINSEKTMHLADFVTRICSHC